MDRRATLRPVQFIRYFGEASLNVRPAISRRTGLVVRPNLDEYEIVNSGWILQDCPAPGCRPGCPRCLLIWRKCRRLEWCLMMFIQTRARGYQVAICLRALSRPV